MHIIKATLSEFCSLAIFYVVKLSIRKLWLLHPAFTTTWNIRKEPKLNFLSSCKLLLFVPFDDCVRCVCVTLYSIWCQVMFWQCLVEHFLIFQYLRSRRKHNFPWWVAYKYLLFVSVSTFTGFDMQRFTLFHLLHLLLHVNIVSHYSR